MITNTDITVFHKGINSKTKLETWTRFYFKDCWWFSSNGSLTNKGYEAQNRVSIRIPYEMNENLKLSYFSIGDIICQGNIKTAIQKQPDVPGAYNITSITDNKVGASPHIHLGGS